MMPPRLASGSPDRKEMTNPEHKFPTMARAMVEAALDAGVPCAYDLGDAVYGADSSLRRMLETREQPYVLAV